MTMEPVTRTYRDVEMRFEMKRHDRERNKLWVEFAVNGSKYRNGQLLSSVATEEQVSAALGSLELWAHQIINDHVSE